MLPIAVLAGGFGTRLGSLTQTTPKCMLPINGKPFVYWQIQLLKRAGFKDFVFCVSHLSDEIQGYVQDGSRFGIKVTYSLDGETQLGTGGAIVKALPLLGSDFAVIYGDSYLPIDYSSIELAFKKSSTPGMMSIFKNFGKFDKSNSELLSGGYVNYQKGSKSIRMSYIDYGLMYFKAEVFETLKANQDIDLADICEQLSKTKKLVGFEVFERFYEIGSIKGIEEFSEYIRKANL